VSVEYYILVYRFGSIWILFSFYTPTKSTEIETLTKEIDRLEELNGQLNSESLSLQQQVNITQGMC
jgi:hypothetical protein